MDLEGWRATPPAAVKRTRGRGVRPRPTTQPAPSAGTRTTVCVCGGGGGGGTWCPQVPFCPHSRAVLQREKRTFVTPTETNVHADALCFMAMGSSLLQRLAVGGGSSISQTVPPSHFDGQFHCRRAEGPMTPCLPHPSTAMHIDGRHGLWWFCVCLHVRRSSMRGDQRWCYALLRDRQGEKSPVGACAVTALIRSECGPHRTLFHAAACVGLWQGCPEEAGIFCFEGHSPPTANRQRPGAPGGSGIALSVQL